MKCSNTIENLYNEQPKIFETFLASTNAKTAMNDFLLNFITKHVSDFKKNENLISLLDIGCGPCAVEKFVLPKLFDRFPKIKIKVTLIDSCAGLQQDVQWLSANVPDPEYYYIQSSIENIQSQEIVKDQQKYDWIICSHLLYYLNNWQTEINRYLSWLADTGVLFVSLRSKNSPILQLQKIFSTLTKKHSTRALVYGENVVENFIDTGIEHQFFVVNSIISIPVLDVYSMPTKVSDLAESENQALQIIKFYTHCELWKNVSDEILHEARTFLLSNVVSDFVQVGVREIYIVAYNRKHTNSYGT